jgi:hypothetical protein
MKLTIQKEDLHRIWGKYIFQINAGEDWDLTKLMLEAKSNKGNPDFYFAKRICQYFSIGETVYCADLYGNMYKYADTLDRFLELFNDYKLKSGAEKERYHRLLTSSELKTLFKFIKKRNY